MEIHREGALPSRTWFDELAFCPQCSAVLAGRRRCAFANKLRFDSHTFLERISQPKF